MSDDLVERARTAAEKVYGTQFFNVEIEAAIAVVLEEAAIYCEMKSNDYWCEGYECCDSTLQQAAAAIRALVKHD